jgi:dTDP-4-dehydrorhamnose 3,5-epimerase
VTGKYTPDAERGQRWNDPALGLEWPLEVSTISAKDAGWALLEDVNA